MNEYIVRMYTVIGLGVFLLTVGPLVGGLVGWLFAMVFDDSFKVLCNILRVEATGFQVGAALGFAGAFLRTTVSKV